MIPMVHSRFRDPQLDKLMLTTTSLRAHCAKLTCSMVSVCLWSGSMTFLMLAGSSAPATCQETGPQFPDELLTVAEKSNYEATSLTAEVDAFMTECASRGDHASVFEFGKTSKEVPMRGLLIANPPVETRPDDGRIVVLLLGNIHSGECDGKEALLMMARELTLNPDHEWLKKIVFLFVPNYNADANDMVAPNNRRGQIGPEKGMGKRENAQGFDLNRDFMKLESPEARSLIGLVQLWDPHMFVDCHTTNGSRHRYQLTYDVPHNPASPSPLRKYLREKMMPEVTEKLREQNLNAFYYGNFDREKTKWTTYGFEPRYSTEYIGMRGRLGILSESYSYISYRERIEATRAFVSRCLDFASANSETISQLTSQIDQQWADITGQNPGRFDLPLDAVMSKFDEPATILGFSGNGDEPEDFVVEFWGDYQPAAKVNLPWAYLLPDTLPEVIANLQNHGIQVERLKTATGINIQFQTVQAIRRSPQPFQGHAMVRLQTNSGREKRDFPAGTLVVRTAQPLGRLAVWLLEPQSVDGLVTWNYFDDVIQQGQEIPVWRIDQPAEIPLEALEPVAAKE